MVAASPRWVLCDPTGFCSLECERDGLGPGDPANGIAMARVLETVTAMSLVEVKIEIPAASAVSLADALLEAGLEQWSILEDAIAQKAWLIGILGDEARARAAWSRVELLLGPAGAGTRSVPDFRTLADADWRDSYKAHFRAWQFERLHWVPVWERGSFSLPPGDAVLWLDPGLAFGTGNHETTRLCVERLVSIATARGGSGRVIDAGCGSGILALSAVLLGFRDVVGFDNDPEAVRISEENAAVNDLTGRVTFFVGDLESGLAGREADVVLANIQADILRRHARELLGAIAPGGTLVMSGILAQENAAVREVFEPLTNTWTVNARTMGEWSDIVLTRPG